MDNRNQKTESIDITSKRIEIGKRIRKIRKANKESQEELAAAINLTQDSISKIETGKSSLSLETQLLIAQHYKISHDYLIDGLDRNNILETLNNYISVKYTLSSTGYGYFSTPTIHIKESLWNYLLRIANINNDKNIPETVKKTWSEIEIKNFYNNEQNDNVVEFVPVPENLICPDEKKEDWAQTDLLRNVHNYFYNQKTDI